MQRKLAHVEIMPWPRRNMYSQVLRIKEKSWEKDTDRLRTEEIFSGAVVLHGDVSVVLPPNENLTCVIFLMQEWCHMAKHKWLQLLLMF